MGYHRQLTHGSFCTYRPIRLLFALIGGLSGEGSALMWVANHRKHHVFSDKEGDPHSPRDGKWWSHMLWFMPGLGRGSIRQPWWPAMPPIWPRTAACACCTSCSCPRTDPDAALLLPGRLFWLGRIHRLVVRRLGHVRATVYVLHVTWFVNSATHIWGYRNYETTDNSRNLWWVGLLAFGEGWHNNHHAFQRMARQGHKWWEVDVTYWAICLMEKVGLVWNVVHEIPKGANPA